MRLVLTGMACAFLSILAPRWLPDAGPLLAAFGAGGILLILVGVGALFVPGTDHTGEPLVIQPPVQGRWLALNSPATKVPSHGVRAYGQAYAVDLVFEPQESERPQFGSGPGMRRPTDFPAFGEPVLSPVPGTVVRVQDSARDHRSRSRLWAVGYMMIEGMLRELGGVRNIVGNHVVIDAGDGCFALVAHLQRGSAQVGAGDQVEAGQALGRCGNSGNSSEPHVHVQLMDRANPSTAQGLPMTFTGIAIGDGQPTTGMPANGEYMTVS
ncbi:peptidoglycan DD-metalloendopeptidase family protein [Phytoactinopolyspora sp. XMNu-373]|uniref:Peptidoglycan DD-metalloendopeptidase family protein n=2 Tax=Phytoactinopolyspora mesophila TaxID=2650750 RepID=A0A7K3M1F9_9ACTN|nr:peptidoglycan DD-metalloendopeptidase family protein [Phytoactinopolyspora mesophila]